MCTHACKCACVYSYMGVLVGPIVLCLTVCSHRYLIHQTLRCWVLYVLTSMPPYVNQLFWQDILQCLPTLAQWAITPSLLRNSFENKLSVNLGAAFAFAFPFLRSREGFRFLAWLLNPQEMYYMYHIVFIQCCSFRQVSKGLQAVEQPGLD